MIRIATIATALLCCVGAYAQTPAPPAPPAKPAPLTKPVPLAQEPSAYCRSGAAALFQGSGDAELAAVQQSCRRGDVIAISAASQGSVFQIGRLPPASAGADDGALRLAFENLVATDAAIAGLHKTFGDDADSREDYLELEEQRDECIATLIEVPAASMAGILAKASALRLDVMIEDYDQHQQIAVSLADDLICLDHRAIG
jgi:hypothetical protein